MTHVDIHPMGEADIALMAQKMRPMDRFEFDVMTAGQPVEKTLTRMTERTKGTARAGYVDGELVAVYGISRGTTLTKSGSPWLLATNEIEKPHVRRVFLERGRDELLEMAEGFFRLWNVVSEENTIAIRWLKWMGFDFDGKEYMIFGHRFLRFQMEAENVH